MQTMALTYICLLLLVVIRKNFSTFRMPLNFLSTIFNRKTSLKKAEISQRNLNKKIDLKFDYRPKNEKKRRNKWSIGADK